MIALDDPRVGYALLAAVGGVMYQLFKHADQSQRLNLVLLVLNALIAGFVGVVVGEIASGRVPAYASAIIALSGFFAFPLLRRLEAAIPGLVERLAGKAVAGKDDDEPDDKPRRRRRRRSAWIDDEVDELAETEVDELDREALRGRMKLRRPDRRAG